MCRSGAGAGRLPAGAKHESEGYAMTTLLRNGLVYDGTQNPPRRLDVLLDGERIAAVGERIEADGANVIDCEGLCVAPGLIDAHSHNDFFYDLDDAEGYYKPFIMQGITTQVTGNCGFSVFGVEAGSPYAGKVGAGLFRARNAGGFAAFKDAAQGKLHVNLVPLIGHGTARIGITGLAPRKLTPAEMARELAMVDDAMRGGAFGGSFGFMYEPGMYAPHDELVAFASKIAQYGGILTVHPRANSSVALGYPLLSKPHIELALDEVIGIMRESGVKTQYSHLIFVGQSSWKCLEPMLAKFVAARTEGFDIAYDHYSMTYGASVITVICPPWYMALPAHKRHTPLNRLKLRVIIDITRKALGIGYQDITVASIADNARQYEGRTVADIAREEGMDPLDLYLKLIDLSGGEGRVYLGKYYNEAILRRLMADDLSLCMTDAWVEGKGVQNASAYQGYPNFLLNAQAWGVPFERVIHKMTGGVAERFGIRERGILAAGNYADVTVFDAETLQVKIEQPDFTPKGIRHVVVNGVFAVQDGQYVTQRAGMVLQKQP